MARTRIPLDVTFFDREGQPVDTLRMNPCPNPDDANCPAYAARRPYRYALERPAGASGGGALAGCAA
jgi:uncharacterized membrane protein (UPF0127 family)